jgi:hypothetical protein
MTKVLYTLDEAAPLLGYRTANALRMACMRGFVQSVKVGRRRFITREELQRMATIRGPNLRLIHGG